MDTPHALHEIVGVYHADGGPIGEARYVIGKLLGTAHCALCDITHSPVRRKREWDRMVAELGLPSSWSTSTRWTLRSAPPPQRTDPRWSWADAGTAPWTPSCCPTSSTSWEAPLRRSAPRLPTP